MAGLSSNRLMILKAYLWIMCVFTLFWWPLSHWFYSSWYHRLLGFEHWDETFVKIIGTSGFLVVLNIFFAALDPVKNRAMILSLIVFSALMATTFVFLIFTAGLPVREFCNVALLTTNIVVLVLLYPRHTTRDRPLE